MEEILISQWYRGRHDQKSQDTCWMLPKAPTQSTFEMDTLSTSQESPRSRGKESMVQGSISNKDYALGVAMLLVVICMWTASSFIAQVKYNCGVNHKLV